MSELTFRGYRRENGRVGVRNHTILLPLDDLSNAACEAVANNVKGTMAIPHALWPPAIRRGSRAALPHDDRDRLPTRTSPPVIVIGIEPELDQGGSPTASAETGKPVAEGFSIEQLRRFRDHPQRASLEAAQGVRALGDSELQKEPCPLNRDLWVSTKCGESDTTTRVWPRTRLSATLSTSWIPLGMTSCFGETSEITGCRDICAKRAAATPEAG